MAYPDNGSKQKAKKGRKRPMELMKQVDSSRTVNVKNLLMRATHVELAQDWRGIKELRHELKALRENLDAVLHFVTAFENVPDEEVPICIQDIRARALSMMSESAKLLHSFRFPEGEIKEKIASLSFEYKNFKIDVEGLCLLVEGESTAELVEAAL